MNASSATGYPMTLSYSTDSDESYYKDDFVDFDNNCITSRYSQSSVTCTPIPVHFVRQSSNDKISFMGALSEINGNNPTNSTHSHKTKDGALKDNTDVTNGTSTPELGIETSTPEKNGQAYVVTPKLTFKDAQVSAPNIKTGTDKLNTAVLMERIKFTREKRILPVFWLPNSEINGLMRIPSLSSIFSCESTRDADKLYMVFTQIGIDIIQDVSNFKSIVSRANHTPFIILYTYNFKSMHFRVVRRKVDKAYKATLYKSENGFTDNVTPIEKEDRNRVSYDETSNTKYTFYRSFLSNQDENTEPSHIKVGIESTKTNIGLNNISYNENHINDNLENLPTENPIDLPAVLKDHKVDPAAINSVATTTMIDQNIEDDSTLPNDLFTECKLITGLETTNNITWSSESIANFRCESVIKRNFNVFILNGSSNEMYSADSLIKLRDNNVLYHIDDINLYEGDLLKIKFPTIYTKHFEHDTIKLYRDDVIKSCFNMMKVLVMGGDLNITVNKLAQYCPTIFWNLAIVGDVECVIREIAPECIKSMFKRKRTTLINDISGTNVNGVYKSVEQSLGYNDNEFVTLQTLFKKDAEDKVQRILEIERQGTPKKLDSDLDDTSFINAAMEDDGILRLRINTLTERQKYLVYKESMKRNYYVPVHIKFNSQKGRTVVAAYKISKDDFMMEFKGELVTEKVAQFRSQKYSKSKNFKRTFIFFFKYNGRKYGIDATDEDICFGPARLINYSKKNANITPKILCSGNYPRLIFVAKQEIECGEELLIYHGDVEPEIIKDNI